MKYGIKVNITHVSGKITQAQNIDDVSRGSLRIGVAVGKEMIGYCPWGKRPLDVVP